MTKKITGLISLLFIITAIIIWPVSVQSQTEKPVVYTVTVEDMVTAGTARNINRAIEHSQNRNADALVIQLNTPGGLVDATLDIIQDISASPVPIITYVTPKGAIAASAGTFILVSGHLAAMTPGTTCGAAMPVTMDPQEGGTEAADQKTINFLAEHMRSVAEDKGRPGDIAEKFVLENLSLGSQTALEEGVIDVEAENLEELLQIIDGREVITAAGKINLKTAGAEPFHLTMSTEEKLIHIISNPTLAVIFLILGIYGLIIAFSSPGFMLPEVLGSISLILGLFGLGLFEVNLAAGLLIILGILLLVAELFTPTYGILGVGGVVSIILGIVFLPIEPLMPVNWFAAFRGMAISVGIVGAGFLFIVLKGILNLRRIKPMQGPGEFAADEGIVIEPLDPAGVIKIRGEIWRAKSLGGETIPAGTRIKVVKRDNIQLLVEKDPDQPAETAEEQ